MRATSDHSDHIILFVFTIVTFMLMSIVGAVAQMSHGTMAGMHMSGHKTGTKAVDVIRDPTDVPAPIDGRPPTVVHVTLTAKEVVGHLDPASGSDYRYWTFNGKVPAPMIRVRQGDTVEVTLKNDPTSHMAHSVDFHAALGPGGGAAFSEAVPGQSKTFSFQATTPGLFVYHCGTPMIAEHIANGMYGLILVEPAEGLPHVDHEYYVMQGEVYTAKPKGTPGVQEFSGVRLMQEKPEYFVFNGAVDALTSEHPLKAKTGETVRIFFGDAGPNLPSSLHVVGEIFTKEYVAGALTSAPQTGVQTASVAPGSAALLELKATTPGKFNFMDHAMSRMAKGLMGTIEVNGQENAALMHAGPAPESARNAAPVMGITESDAAQAEITEPIAGKGDVDPAGLSMSMHEGRAQLTTSEGAAARPANVTPTRDSKMAAFSSKSPTEMAGCLDYQAGTVTMKAWPTGTVYRLQARPLLFAQHANQLVYVTGHVGSILPSRPSMAHDPSFVVDTVDQLAPNCNAQVTPALLRTVVEPAEDAVPSTAASSSISMGMTEMAFSKPRITIQAGQSVVWKNTSQTVHNVVDDASKAMSRVDVQLPAGVKPFGSGLLQPGQSYSHAFSVPGTYRYVCTLHEGMGMKGEIVVK